MKKSSSPGELSASLYAEHVEANCPSLPAETVPPLQCWSCDQQAEFHQQPTGEIILESPGRLQLEGELRWAASSGRTLVVTARDPRPGLHAQGRRGVLSSSLAAHPRVSAAGHQATDTQALPGKLHAAKPPGLLRDPLSARPLPAFQPFLSGFRRRLLI